MCKLLTGHLVEDDKRQDIYPGTSVRTHGCGTDKQITLLVEDECQFCSSLIMGVEEEKLAVRNIRNTILIVLSSSSRPTPT